MSAFNATFSRSIFDALWKDLVFELLMAEWRPLMIFNDSSISFDKLSLAFRSSPGPCSTLPAPSASYCIVNTATFCFRHSDYSFGYNFCAGPCDGFLSFFESFLEPRLDAFALVLGRESLADDFFCYVFDILFEEFRL